MDETFSLFAKDDKFSDIDFIFPALTKDKSGFIPRPASNSQIIAIIREELCRAVATNVKWETTDKSGNTVNISSHEAIKLFTMASCRVLIPEWANKADVPIELRRWLGRWREDSTADRYTRDHRGKIIEIMALLDGKEHLMITSSEVPEDISDDHFIKPPPAPLMDGPGDPGFAPLWAAAPDSCLSPSIESPAKAARTGAAEQDDGYTLVEMPTTEELLGEDEEDEIWYETRTLLLKSLGGNRFPSSKLPPHLDGPLSLVKTKSPTGALRIKKVHLALTTRVTVGCGMDATKCDIITEEERIPSQATHALANRRLDPRICARCFKFFFWDTSRDTSLLSDTWDDETTKTDEDQIDTSSDDSMPSVSGDSSNSNDSESEEEALRPP